MKERRAYRRYAIGFGAELHAEDGIIPAATHDVSRGGCRLESTDPLPEGGFFVVDLKLTVDGIQEIDFPALRVGGRVRWSAEGEAHGEQVYFSGLQFEGMTDDQAQWLESVLEKHGVAAPD